MCRQFTSTDTQKDKAEKNDGELDSGTLSSVKLQQKLEEICCFSFSGLASGHWFDVSRGKNQAKPTFSFLFILTLNQRLIMLSGPVVGKSDNCCWQSRNKLDRSCTALPFCSFGQLTRQEESDQAAHRSAYHYSWTKKRKRESMDSVHVCEPHTHTKRGSITR